MLGGSNLPRRDRLSSMPYSINPVQGTGVETLQDIGYGSHVASLKSQKKTAELQALEVAKKNRIARPTKPTETTETTPFHTED